MTCCNRCYDSYIPYITSLRDPYMREIINEKKVFSRMSTYASEHAVTRKCTTPQCILRGADSY